LGSYSICDIVLEHSMDVDTLKRKCKGLCYDGNINIDNAHFIIYQNDTIEVWQFISTKFLLYGVENNFNMKYVDIDNRFYDILKSFCKYLGYTKINFKNYVSGTDIFLQR